MLTWQTIPEWMKDNPAIYGGYRHCQGSWARVARNLFVVHNQTVNVWTHLVGAVYAAVRGARNIADADSAVDAWAWMPLVGGTTTMFLFSTIFHIRSA